MSEISDKKFLGFTWPPKMPSYKFSRKENQVWIACIYPSEHIITTDTLPIQKYVFETEQEARACKKILQRSRMNPLVIVSSTYDVDEEGWI